MRSQRPAPALLGLALALLSAAPARAAGLYYLDRGVRPLARGGAFVAGADDLGAIAYNPAGIFDAGKQFLVDGSYVAFSSTFDRQALIRQVDPNTGRTVAEFVQTFPRVEGKTPFLPIPTLGMSFPVHRDWVFALGTYVPYAALTTYPAEVRGKPAPQRYSLLSLDGSALAIVGGYLAHAPSKKVRLGVGLEVLTGVFRSTVVLSGCVPDRFFCAPEQPEYDVLAELAVGPIVAPTTSFGAIYVASNSVRLGASLQLPFLVRSRATLKARLPEASVFDRASQEGDSADVSFDLPPVLRAGVEFRPQERLRVELGADYEGWSMHDSIDLDPDGVSLKNVAGFPEHYLLPNVSFPRNFQDSISVRAGGEIGVAGGAEGSVGVVLRAGASYETSAVPAEWLNVLTLDSDKATLAAGLGITVGKVRVDATFAHVLTPDVHVDPREAAMPQVSPVQANLPERPHTINGGTYSTSTNVFGLGLAYTFDPPPAARAEPAPAEKASEHPEGEKDEPPPEDQGDS